MKRIIAAFFIVGAFPSAASAQELTVYSSLPLSGASRVQTTAVNDGARRALREAGGTAAGKPVRLTTLNNATARAGSWTVGRTRANARRAARDASTVAYIGEFNSGGSKLSIPILNRAGIPQVSPSNTYNGLTTPIERGEPGKYYPTGVRTYFRIVPNDHVQAAALVTAMRDRGCKALGLVHDGEVYGQGMNADVVATAARLGLPVVANRRISRGAPTAIRRAKADCMAYTGITANGAVRLFRSSALRGMQLFGSDGVAESGFVDPLPRSVERRTFVTVATVPPPAAFGNRDPYYVYGYEAMKLILDGLNASGGTRAGLLGWLPTVQNRQSVLGTYGFDANGDTTLRTYGLYSVGRNSLRYEATITAA
ncbi:branched-chain amino acid ABC transporter substrate-binding protein [Solirubrobacter sp. CPCC 204708]|uniref:Branched-chain amino acid ABC transporter substrate-binding protein n=1 Tax=Solirubrobacter deserti TaxID=2282478 RepID=A0ABT4RSC2_9ACTN|nr:branched-chain amino acid ABC transporter substrate-binding protein [Solirubrobacter deserti]MBE2317589.1 branched-chain amino acid ABC transporter substrate-binding protein [Solirubrobacter deserti]MDA0141283.1 branched-chain amino acid ABC transporter substrate-binding protein [Solirubrobacter deserti]